MRREYTFLSAYLSGAISAGQTVTFPYPAGLSLDELRTESAVIYAGTGGVLFSASRGDFVVSLGSAGAAVTFLKAFPTPPGAELRLELPVFSWGGQPAPNSQLRAKPQHRATFQIHSSAVGTNVSTGAWTWSAAIPLEDDIIAVRFVFMNHTAAPYAIGGVCYCPSDSFNDYSNPTGSTDWRWSTWNSAGADSDIVYDAGTALAATTVPANSTDASTGSTDIPHLYFSDWNYASTIPRADGSKIRVLFARLLVGAQTTAVLATGTNNNWTINSATNRGREYAIRAQNEDRVTTPTTPMGTATTSNHPFYAFQFLYRSGAITLCMGGDSQIAGTGTSANYANFVIRAALALSDEGAPPVVPWNVAWGGQSSNKFWPVLNNAIVAGKPGIVLIEGWSGNDSGMNTNAAYDKQHARMLQSAQRVRDYGGVPILTTPMPRTAATQSIPANLANWQYARERLLEMREHGFEVFDAGVVVSDLATGRFLPGMADDDLHPNDAGHSALATAFLPTLRRIIRD